jgi:hypothetical protein
MAGYARMTVTGHSLMGAPQTRLATYGTLAPGHENHGQLSDLSGRWLVGHVRGSLVEAGWGAKLGYPGMILDLAIALTGPGGPSSQAASTADLMR